MTRVGKKAQRKNQSPRKRRPHLFEKTGPKKEKVPFKRHTNTLKSDSAFIPNIKSR